MYTSRTNKKNVENKILNKKAGFKENARKFGNDVISVA